MSRLRSLLRAGAAAFLTGICVLRPLAVAAGTLGRRGAVARSGSRTLHALSRALVPLCGVRVERAGPPLPPGPCLVCPNHVSYLDILLVAREGAAVFVSRGDVQGWPGIGPASRLGGTIYVDRARRRDAARAADEIGACLDLGLRVVVFLEGRNGTGEGVLPFRSSLLEPAVARGVPCVPVAVTYAAAADTGAVVARDVAWADDTPFAAHAARLLGLRRVHARVAVGAPRRGADRKALAAALEADVRALAATPAADPSPDR